MTCENAIRILLMLIQSFYEFMLFKRLHETFCALKKIFLSLQDPVKNSKEMSSHCAVFFSIILCRHLNLFKNICIKQTWPPTTTSTLNL